MNTLLLEHLAAVSKIAAYRQAREHQEGVDASKGHLSVASNMGMTGDNLSVVSAFRAPEPNGKAQYVTTLIRDNHRYSLWMETQGYFYCGTGGGSQSLSLGDLAAGTDHLVALCRDGGTLYCYLDGELKGTLGVYDFVAADGFFVGRAAINQDTLFTSTIYSARVFDYTLSAEEVAALYNNGDPAGYVLPTLKKKFWEASDTQIAAIVWSPNGVGLGTMEGAYTDNANGFDGRYARMKPGTNGFSMYSSRLYSSNVPGLRLRVTFKYRSSKGIHMATTSSINVDLPANTGDAVLVEGLYSPPDTYVYGFNFNMDASSADDWVEIQPVYIGYIGCVAEYLPQNLIAASKQDFPQVVFPNGRYTPSKDTYTFNNSTTTTALWDQPQANGFSGPFMRFEAITNVSIYNDYWGSYLKGVVPVVVTAEYRSTKPLYHRTAISSKYIFIADANEGDAKIITIMVPDYTGSSRISFADVPVTADDWLELRVLSIEVAEGVVTSWLDSAKQLPLNDEYLPPLLETAGGYDMAANGTPEIVYKPE